MPKQLNVNLAFTADTSQAKAQLQDLQNQLQKLATSQNSSGSGFFLTREIQQASSAAVDLRNKLTAATDINTGKLDLSKFSQSLKASSKTLEDYRVALSSMGPQGEQAFASLATSISKAEVPLRTTNRLLSEFKTTLMNTARWQISSSVLHGFMGTLQSAYGYAQDLNASLNNIRIVTGQSADQMAAFAAQANKSAQALSTTTTAYTDAALIFYQQGLDDKAVQERTDATIKMAQATGDSAKDVSSYMTAIWNNFDDGSESLEHYADVITALGASTASSSSEIASGLQQFAAIAKTTGLSYDYATSALATLVANTRQSADTIGNSLKTIFSRLQGLQMGETLDDGLDLNKYSKALKAIGVDVLDINGNMMQMDDVLDQTAEKWDNMTQAQKMAFAQTVAGTRQYTQLMALMDNWDDMQTNLQTVEDADGTLQEQADIYAESWEAAQKRVRAAAEKIYESLLNDDFFIALLDDFKGFLDIISNTIDAMGGLKGVLIAVGALVTNIFGKEIASEINRVVQNMRILTGAAKQDATARKQEASDQMQKMTADSVDENTGAAMSTVYQQQGKLQSELIAKEETLTAERQRELQVLMDINSALGQNVIKAGQEADAAQRALKAEKDRVAAKARRSGMADANNRVTDFSNQMEMIGRMQAGADSLKAAFQESANVSFENVKGAFERIKTDAAELQNHMDSTSAEQLDLSLKNVEDILKRTKVGADGMLEPSKEDAQMLEQEMIRIQSLIEQTGDGIMSTASVGKNEEDLEELGNQAYETGRKVETSRQQLDGFNASSGKLSSEIQKPVKGMQDFGQKATATAQAITSTIMVMNTLGSVIKTISNPDLSKWEKFTTILSSIGMTIPVVISTFTSLAVTFDFVGAAATAMWEAITGPVGLAIIGITAAVAAIAGLSYAIYKALNPDKDAQLKKDLEDATKSANELQEATKTAKNYVDDLKSAFDKYTEVRTALDNCTEGTTDWYNAVNDVKGVVDELLETYPELAKYLEYNPDGSLSFQEGAVESVITVAEQKQAALNSATNYEQKLRQESSTQLEYEGDKGLISQATEELAKATANLNNAQEAIPQAVSMIAEQIPELSQNFVDEVATSYAQYKNSQTRYIDATNNYNPDDKDSIAESEAAQEQLDLDYEAYTMALSDAIYRSILEGASDGSEKAIEEIKNMSTEEARAVAQQKMATEGHYEKTFLHPIQGEWKDATDGSKELQDTIDNVLFYRDNDIVASWSRSYIDNKNSIDELTQAEQDAKDRIESLTQDREQAMQNAQDEWNAQNTLIARSLLQGEDYIKDLADSNSFYIAAGEKYGSMLEEKINEIKEKDDDLDYQTTVRNFLAAQGEDLSKISNIGLDKESNTYKYKKDGEEVEQGISKDSLAAYMASMKIQGNFADFMRNKWMPAINDASESAKAAGAATAEAKELESEAAEKAAEAQAKAVKLFGENKNLESLTFGEKQNLDTLGVTKKATQGTLTLEDLGLTKDQVIKMGYQDAQDYITSFSKAITDADSFFDTDKLKSLNVFGDDVKDQLTYSLANTMADAANEADLGPAGKEAGENLLNNLNLALSNLDADKKISALEALFNSGIDWSNTNAGEQAIATLKDLGITLNTTSEGWVNFVDGMQKANGAVPDFSQIVAQLEIIEKIQKSKVGDTVDKEDMTGLLTIFPQLEDYLISVDDKTYQWTKDFKEIENIDLSSLLADMQSCKDLQEAFSDNEGIKLDSDYFSQMFGDEATITKVEDLQNALSTLLSDDNAQPLLEKLGYTEDRINELLGDGATAEELLKLFEVLQAFMGIDTSGIGNFVESQLAAAETIEELKNVARNNDVDVQQYIQSLTLLASQYDNTKSELENLTQAQEEYNEAIAAAAGLEDEEATAAEQAAQMKLASAMAEVEMATMAGEAAQAYGIDANVFEAFMDEIAEMEEYVGATTDEIAQLGIAYARANEGLNDLCENSTKYKEVLDEISDNGFAQAMAQNSKQTKSFVTSLANLLNTSEDVAKALLADQKNADALSGALKGDIKDIKALDKEARRLSMVEIGIDPDSFSGGEEALNSLMDKIEEVPEGKEVLIELNGDEEAQSNLQNLMQELWNSSDSLDDFQNHLAELDLFGDVVANTQANMDALTGIVNASAADMAAAGYVLVNNANGITDGLIDALALETDVGSMTDNVQAEGQTESPTPFHPVPNGEHQIQLPGASFSQSGEGSFSFRKTNGPTLTYTGVGWEAGNAETETVKEETPVTQVWVRPRKGGGAGSATHGNRNIGGGGGRDRRRRGGGGHRRSSGGDRGRERSYVSKQHTDTSHQTHDKLGKQISSLSDAYGKLGKAADKAFGGSKIKFLNQQIKLQEEIIKKTREQAKESERLAAIEKKNLTSGNKGIESYYTDTKTGTEYHDKFSLKDIAGVNAKTDGFGNITNKADILKGLDEAYNRATATYNASAQEDSNKAAYERIKAQIEAAKEAISTYEEDVANAASEAEAALNALYDQYDLVLQKASEKIDIKINVDEEALKYIDYILGTIEDDAWKAADAIGYFGQQASHLMSESKTYQNGIADIIDRHNEAMKLDGGIGLGIKGSDFVKKLQSGELTPEMLSATGVQLDPYNASTYTMQNLGLTQDEVDQMQEYADNLLEINQQLEESRANVFETMEQAFDKMNEEMSDNIVKIQHYQKLTQNYNNIIDIVGKKALGITSEMTRAMGEAQTAVAKNLVESSRVKMETLQQEMADAEEKRAAAQAKGLDKDVEYWDNFLKHAEQEYESAQEDFMQNWEEALQTAADVFAATVDDICSTLDDALAGTAGSLESLRNSFNMQNEMDDDYVDDYERVYQLTKLTRNIEKSIDDTDNIKSKKELLKLQEEINDQLENNKEMSQYDLDYLQKKYELKMAELAMEEAKDAKSNVSMVKGNDGSYSYVYTANEENVADAEQNYEDKLYEMQKLNAEYINELQESILSLQEQATQKLKEAANMYGTDSEEYAKAMAEIQEWYNTQLQYYSGEMDKVFVNNEILYTEDVAEYAAMTDNKALADEEYVNDFSQTVLSLESGYDDLTVYVNNSMDVMKLALERMNEAEQNYQEHNAEIMAAAETSMTDFANQYVSAATEASESTNQLNNDTANLASDVIENWNNILSNVESFENEYSKKIDNMIAKNNALANSFYKLINAWSQFNDAGAANASTPGGSNGSNNNNPGNDNGKKELTPGRIEGIAASIWMEGGAASGWYDDPTRAARFREKFGADGQKIQTYINQHAENGDIYRNWHNRRGQLAQFHYSQFDTGGYTGSWNNNEGRLAVLHQKELILNASDTENMLAVVELVREISKAIDLNAMAASSAYSNMSSVTVPNQGEEQVIEQQITINAEFPDATKASEIEAAFNNLFINASQYANRK